MSKASDKTMKQLMKYLKENGVEDLSGKETQELIDRYFDSLTPPTAPEPHSESYTDSVDDLLDLAANASNKKQALEYLDRALEIEPDNLDVLLEKTTIESATLVDHLKKLEELIEIGNGQMRANGYFAKGMGEFWLIFNTRPYMRVRYEYFHTLMEAGMMRKAIKEAEELLKLCTNDNLGVRYALMHLYALFEDEKSMRRLYNKYNEYEESQLLMPFAVMYYKLGEFDKAKEYLERLAKVNKDTKKFINAMTKNDLDRFLDDISPYGYRPNTIDEFIVEVGGFEFLFSLTPFFFEWAKDQLKTKKEK